MVSIFEVAALADINVQLDASPNIHRTCLARDNTVSVLAVATPTPVNY